MQCFHVYKKPPSQKCWWLFPKGGGQDLNRRERVLTDTYRTPPLPKGEVRILPLHDVLKVLHVPHPSTPEGGGQNPSSQEQLMQAIVPHPSTPEGGGQNPEEKGAFPVLFQTGFILSILANIQTALVQGISSAIFWQNPQRICWWENHPRKPKQPGCFSQVFKERLIGILTRI